MRLTNAASSAVDACGWLMRRLASILFLTTTAQSAAALTPQQEQVIYATGFAEFVGDYYSPACAHQRLDDEAVQAAWHSAGLSPPDRYMMDGHFRGIGCGVPDEVGNKLCRSYGNALEARNKAARTDKYEEFCRKAWVDFGPGGKVLPGLLKERKPPN
jgi:hypothetical protein